MGRYYMGKHERDKRRILGDACFVFEKETRENGFEKIEEARVETRVIELLDQKAPSWVARADGVEHAHTFEVTEEDTNIFIKDEEGKDLYPDHDFILKKIEYSRYSERGEPRITFVVDYIKHTKNRRALIDVVRQEV